MKRIVLVLAALTALSGPVLAQPAQHHQSGAPSSVSSSGGERAPVNGGS
jgi:hypothetical protein